jgi:hypothetical protein
LGLLNHTATLIGNSLNLTSRFKFASITQQKANLIVLDPPYLQTMSNLPSTDEQVNTLAQINLGLSANQICTTENFTLRILESCLDASEDDAIFFIWCSLEQSLEYIRIHKSGDLAAKGLTAVTHCMVNGKKRIMATNEQLPSSTGEYFVVCKKGLPSQTTFDKWGTVYSEDKPHPKTFPNVFKVPTVWWDSISNKYPFEKSRKVMRLMVNHFARPGHLVFEGFAGTISCGLAALTCGVNLVAVDNNPDTDIYLQDLYNDLQHGLLEMESLEEDWTALDESPAALMFVTTEMERPWPHYKLFCPDDWVQTDVPLVNTEPSSFLPADPIRRPNPSTQPSQSSLKVRKRSYEAINVRKQLKYKTDSEDVGSDNDSLVEGDVSSDY